MCNMKSVSKRGNYKRLSVNPATMPHRKSAQNRESARHRFESSFSTCVRVSATLNRTGPSKKAAPPPTHQKHCHIIVGFTCTDYNSCGIYQFLSVYVYSQLMICTAVRVSMLSRLSIRACQCVCVCVRLISSTNFYQTWQWQQFLKIYTINWRSPK